MTKKILIFIYFFCLLIVSASSSLYASSNTDLQFSVSSNSNKFVSGQKVVFGFELKNIGSSAASPSALNYFLVPNEIEFVKIESSHDKMYCPIDMFLSEDSSPNFGKSFYGYRWLGCTLTKQNYFGEIAPGESIQILLSTKIRADVYNKNIKVIGFHLPDIRIEPNEEHIISEFYSLSNGSGSIEELHTNNLAIYSFRQSAYSSIEKAKDDSNNVVSAENDVQIPAESSFTDGDLATYEEISAKEPSIFVLGNTEKAREPADTDRGYSFLTWAGISIIMIFTLAIAVFYRKVGQEVTSSK